MTFVAELRSQNLPQLYLWQSEPYKERLNGLTLYKGIIIGIAGLLALFLTIVFVVKGAIIFPAAAGLAWAVLAYSCIDFGFFQRIFPISETAERIYRAGAEAVLAATLLVFLFAYLNLNRWHVRYSRVTAFWLVFSRRSSGLRCSIPGGVRRRAHFDRGRRRNRLRSRHPPRDAWLRPGRDADPDLARPHRLGRGGGVHGHGPAHQRPRAAGPDRRTRAHRDVDRLHGHAARLRGRDLHAGPHERQRAPGAGAFRRRRHGVRLGRGVRQDLRQSRGGTPARPQARLARGTGLRVAGADPPVRPRPLPRRPRRRHRAEARPPGSGFPPALGCRLAPLVPIEGPSRRGHGRRGDPNRRHPVRRDRFQNRRGAPASRRRARQPDEPAEPSALLRQARAARSRARTMPCARP